GVELAGLVVEDDERGAVLHADGQAGHARVVLESQRHRLIPVDPQLGTDDAVAITEPEPRALPHAAPRSGLAHERDGHEAKEGAPGQTAPATGFTLQACDTSFDSGVLRSAHESLLAPSHDDFRCSCAV